MSTDIEKTPHSDAAAPAASTPEPQLAAAARKSAGKAVWMGTAVGIGSAAIVAALLYSSKAGKKRD
jgi:hypothetical protein